MPEIRTILCPVDRSEVSRRALRVAVTLAAAHHARVHVVEVIDSVFPPMAEASTVLRAHDEARLALQEDLNWFVASILPDAVKADVQVREGRVAPEILKMAGEVDASVIVMGTHGRSGFERFVLGSVAERVVRKAPCAVLVVPPSESDEVFTLRRVVCAVDFSDASAAALAYAGFLAKPAAANVILLHVLEWPFGDGEAPEPITRLRANLEAQAAADLERIETTAGVKAAAKAVRLGKPARTVAAFAREQAADLVVIGASGRGAVDRAVLGSTAYGALRDAPCPVLTVPLPE